MIEPVGRRRLRPASMMGTVRASHPLAVGQRAKLARPRHRGPQRMASLLLMLCSVPPVGPQEWRTAARGVPPLEDAGPGSAAEEPERARLLGRKGRGGLVSCRNSAGAPRLHPCSHRSLPCRGKRHELCTSISSPVLAERWLPTPERPQCAQLTSLCLLTDLASCCAVVAEEHDGHSAVSGIR